MKKIVKKGAAKKTAAKKEVKEKRITAASVVIGLLGQRQVPNDEAIINTVLDTVEGSKFNKAQLAWYKHQYKTGKWHDGEPQTINQAKAEKAPKAAAKKAAKKTTKATKAEVETEECEEVEA